MRLALLTLAPVLWCAPLFAEPSFITDAMSDRELRKYRDKKRAELQQLAATTNPEKTKDGVAYRIFYCTVYYTPRESGFTAERGFDDTPVTAKGLGDRSYPRSFLEAVRKEGFGRLAKTVKGLDYVRYVGRNRYRFAAAPLGNRGNVLVPRKSCAISSRSPHLRQEMAITIDSATVNDVMGSREWITGDTGGGVHPLQNDL